MLIYSTTRPLTSQLTAHDESIVASYLMSRVGVLAGHHLSAIVVKLPHQRGIGCKRLRRGQLRGLVGSPVPSSSSTVYGARTSVCMTVLRTVYIHGHIALPERGYAAFCADSGARQGHNASSFGKEFSKGLHVGRRSSHHASSVWLVSQASCISPRVRMRV